MHKRGSTQPGCSFMAPRSQTQALHGGIGVFRLSQLDYSFVKKSFKNPIQVPRNCSVSQMTGNLTTRQGTFVGKKLKNGRSDTSIRSASIINGPITFKILLFKVGRMDLEDDAEIPSVYISLDDWRRRTVRLHSFDYCRNPCIPCFRKPKLFKEIANPPVPVELRNKMEIVDIVI